ncbi:MAG: (deoxy)nucleoside triphosphate pyrophosphohydrolase [Spirochaetales bacterium]|uniref:8-oxo-dGTP diphosphatase n=1 Tax=Candidatus Thalassospirochaeta sargassi TaxID=3119039 RepID=A0AAJ1IJV4_9SPIO|nr:(deoxy)nucleoside triphosphate pyrophosphohydrolase [Spirochaetales bacterium]
MIKNVAAAVVFHDGKVLICRRASGEKLEGFWEFPGGKLEAGESMFDCIERELFEELGVKARGREILAVSFYAYEHSEIRLTGILTELFSDEISLTVHDAFDWVYPVSLSEYKLAPADIPIAEAVVKYGID